MPLTVIMTAANTVSRASDAVSGPPDATSVTMSATSMTVTATASTSEPNGSPTRCATTSAWCTAASTAPASTTATPATSSGARSRPQTAARTTTANGGRTVLHDRRAGRRSPGPGSSGPVAVGASARSGGSFVAPAMHPVSQGRASAPPGHGPAQSSVSESLPRSCRTALVCIWQMRLSVTPRT